MERQADRIFDRKVQLADLGVKVAGAICLIVAGVVSYFGLTRQITTSATRWTFEHS